DPSSGDLLIAEGGNLYHVGDGGIERVDPVARTARGFFVTEDDLGGSVTHFVVVPDTEGAASVLAAAPPHLLVAFHPQRRAAPPPRARPHPVPARHRPRARRHALARRPDDRRPGNPHLLAERRSGDHEAADRRGPSTLRAGVRPMRAFRRLTLAAILALLAAQAHATPFVDRVVSMTIGTGGGGGSIEKVLGPPRGGGPFQGSRDTFSLGLGGSIVLEFTEAIVDGPGADFTVFENAFLTRGTVTGTPFAEPATVSVSADGEHFLAFPCALDDDPYYPGCAGVYPVFANADDPAAPSPLEPSTTPIADLVGVPIDTFMPPAGSGGDSFDLATVGLPMARFVRIEASMLHPRLPAP